MKGPLLHSFISYEVWGRRLRPMGCQVINNIQIATCKLQFTEIHGYMEEQPSNDELYCVARIFRAWTHTPKIWAFSSYQLVAILNQ